jgi:hypothetical protein
MIVSDKFIKIYQDFNVVSQIKEMTELSEEELLLILIVTFRTYSHTDVVMETFKYFQTELEYIDSVLFDSNLTDKEKLRRREIILDSYLDTDKILDGYGNLLPKPTTEEEAIDKRRLFNLNNILNS